MRFAVYLAAMLLVATPVLADNPGNGDPIFGQVSCQPAFACPPSMDSENLRLLFPQILAKANACVASRFAMRNTEGYFEESLGLDYELCLTSKAQPRSVKGLTMTPKCCVVQSASNPRQCQIICTRYGTR